MGSSKQQQKRQQKKKREQQRQAGAIEIFFLEVAAVFDRPWNLTEGALPLWQAAFRFCHKYKLGGGPKALEAAPQQHMQSCWQTVQVSTAFSSQPTAKISSDEEEDKAGAKTCSHANDEDSAASQHGSKINLVEWSHSVDEMYLLDAWIALETLAIQAVSLKYSALAEYATTAQALLQPKGAVFRGFSQAEMEAGVELLASLDKHGSAARHHNFGSWLLIYMKNGGTFPTTPGPFSTFVSLLQFPDLIPYMIKPLHDLLSQTSDQLYAGAEARVRKAIMETLLQDKVLPLQPGVENTLAWCLRYLTEWVVRPSSMPVAARAEDLAQRSMVPMLLTLLRLGRKICIETRGEGGSFLGPAVELARLLLPMEPFVERFASSEFVNSMLELTQIMILHFEDCVSSMLASSICALSCALLPNMQDAVVTRVSHNSADLAATARRHLQAGGQALWSFPALVAAFAHRHEIPGDAPQLMMDIIADSKQAPLARIQAMTTMGVIMDIAPQLVSEELLARLLACVPNMVGCLRAGIPQMGEDECVYAMTSVAFHLGWLKALGSRHPAVLDDAVKAGIVDVLAEMLCADTRGLTSAGIQLIWLWVKQPNALGGYIENSGLECVMQALVAAKQRSAGTFRQVLQLLSVASTADRHISASTANRRACSVACQTLGSSAAMDIYLWVLEEAVNTTKEFPASEFVLTSTLVFTACSTMLGHCLQHLHGEPIDCLLAGFSAFLHVAEQATRPSDPSSPANILESYGSFLALFKRLAAHQPSCFDRAQAESLGQLLVRALDITWISTNVSELAKLPAFAGLSGSQWDSVQASLMTAVLDYKRGDVLAILLDLCSLDEARRFVTHEPLWQELVQLAKTKRKHKQAKAKAKQAGPRAEHDKQAEVAAEAAMRALLEEEEQDKARLERVKAKQGRKKGGQPVAVDKTSAQEAACPAVISDALGSPAAWGGQQSEHASSEDSADIPSTSRPLEAASTGLQNLDIASSASPAAGPVPFEFGNADVPAQSAPGWPARPATTVAADQPLSFDGLLAALLPCETPAPATAYSLSDPAVPAQRPQPPQPGGAQTLPGQGSQPLQASSASSSLRTVQRAGGCEDVLQAHGSACATSRPPSKPGTGSGLPAAGREALSYEAAQQCGSIATRMTKSQYLQMLESLCCSITQALPVDPVIAADGYTYERFAIEAWLRRHSTSPMLNTELPHCNLMPNMSAKALIASIARQ